jgi:hypothetical protein
MVRNLFFGAALGLCFATSAFADDPGAAQAALMFSSCMRYSGDIAGLRTWATGAGLKEAPASDAKPYLLGHSGQVFGGSTQAGGVVIASQDDGGCSLFADHADAAALVQDFEGALKQANFTFAAPKRTTRNGKDGMTVVSRDYHIRQDKGRWHVVISTSTPGKSRFEAVMTVAGHSHKH